MSEPNNVAIAQARMMTDAALDECIESAPESRNDDAITVAVEAVRRPHAEEAVK